MHRHNQPTTTMASSSISSSFPKTLLLLSWLLLLLLSVSGALASLRGSVDDDEHLQFTITTTTKHGSADVRSLPPGTTQRLVAAHRKLNNQFLVFSSQVHPNWWTVGSSGTIGRYSHAEDVPGIGGICNKYQCKGPMASVITGYSCGNNKRSCLDLATEGTDKILAACPLGGFRMRVVLASCHCAAGGTCTVDISKSMSSSSYSLDVTDNCSGTEDRLATVLTLQCDSFT